MRLCPRREAGTGRPDRRMLHWQISRHTSRCVREGRRLSHPLRVSPGAHASAADPTGFVACGVHVSENPLADAGLLASACGYGAQCQASPDGVRPRVGILHVKCDILVDNAKIQIGAECFLAEVVSPPDRARRSVHCVSGDHIGKAVPPFLGKERGEILYHVNSAHADRRYFLPHVVPTRTDYRRGSHMKIVRLHDAKHSVRIKRHGSDVVQKQRHVRTPFHPVRTRIDRARPTVSLMRQHSASDGAVIAPFVREAEALPRLKEAQRVA